MCPEIEEHTRAHQHARPACIQAHFERFRGDEMSHPHDQLGTTRLVAVQVHGDQTVNHGTLALPHACLIDRGSTRHQPELGRVMHQIGDFCTPDLVFAGQTVGVRAGAADQFALDDCGPTP